MKHFLIYTNQHKDKELIHTKRIQDYLELKGQRCSIKLKVPDWKNTQTPYIDEDISLPDNVDYIIVLGGDGTMLQAARDVKKSNIPLIGVNLGTLGYLTEIDLETLEESLDRLMEGDFEAESRMMLNGKATAGDGSVKEGWALNDIVISRSGSLQILKFNIYVNGQFLNYYNADGVIITTPTGSTGYNLSAGGPIVEPRAKLIMLTPICPHTLNKRSIIFSPEDVIEIEILEGKDGQTQEVEANFDGSHSVTLCTGDRIRIVKSDKTIEIIKLDQVSFLQILHKKMRET